LSKAKSGAGGSGVYPRNNTSFTTSSETGIEVEIIALCDVSEAGIILQQERHISEVIESAIRQD
jgi:hypothetical protein